MDLARIIAVARGDEPADLVLANARVLDFACAGTFEADIAICGSVVAGVGEGYRGRDRMDLGGDYVAPGFIDAHVHIESSMVTPREFARAVVPRGVTTVISNPHEIANVVGVEGIRFMLRSAQSSPLDVFVTLPSCVPASHLETSGASLDVSDLLPLLDEPKVIGLGEVMDFPGVVSGESRVLTELYAFRRYPIDGHCPGLGGHQLNAYAAAGIRSDHECTTEEEAREKLRLGMRVFIREGSEARNLDALLPITSDTNDRWLCWCTDDRDPSDLLAEGTIDHIVRKAIRGGVPPLTAIQMATVNPAEHFRLYDRGRVAPGYRADLVVFPDLAAPTTRMVYRAGVLVARNGALVGGEQQAGETACETGVRDTVRVDWGKVKFRIPAETRRIRVIGLIPGQLITEHRIADAPIEDGDAVSDPGRDLLKMAVIERHRATGRVGLGFVQGLGLKRGALASTVAHDHHNLVVVGADDLSMMTAAKAVVAAGGGQAVAEAGRVVTVLPLPIAGLMSDQPIETVRDQEQLLIAAARNLGSPLHDPFMALSFLALEVIPSLKLTDLGLVDVDEFRIVSLFVPP